MPVRIAGLNSGMDTDAIVQDLVKAYSAKTDTYKKEQTRLQWKQDAWKSLNTKIYSFHTKFLSDMRFSGAYSKKKTSVSDETKASVVTSDTAVNGIQTLKVGSLARASYLTGGKLKKADVADTTPITAKTTLSELGFSGSTAITVNKGSAGSETYGTLNISGDTTLESVADQLTTMGLSANFDAANGRFFVSAKNTGAAADFSFSGSEGALSMLGFQSVAVGTTPTDDSIGVKVSGSDAAITLNGVNYTSSSNAFTVNGMTISVKGLTEGDEEITLSTDTDYDAIYKNIKEFITEYNKLVNEMDSMYNAASSKGYDPLTEDEKSSMTDSEIEAWEKKIKDSILRKDETIESVTSTMRMAMLQTYTVNGKEMGLSMFGINTLGYFNAADNEKNAYHIDGDPEDSNTSDSKDKLKAAIATNPASVQSFFTQMANNMYDALSTKMKGTEYSSAFTVYDDKRMATEYADYTKKISDWEDKVADIEDRYYKQFAAMEKAMATLNSSSSALSSLLGSGS